LNNWIILPITLIFSGFFSGVEIAYATSNRLRIELELKKNKFSARLLNGFYKNPGRFISALLLGNNIALVVYGIAMATLLEPWIEMWLPEGFNSEFSVLFSQTILSTILILITGEFLPKILFRFNPNGILNALAVPIWIIYYTLFPLVIIYMGIVEFVLKFLFRMELNQNEYEFSSLDLNEYVKEFAPLEESKEMIYHDIQLFQNAIDFRFVKLRECMVPRTEVEAIAVESDVKELLSRFEETMHSKILVYQHNIDNIIGYVHSYDMFMKPKTIRDVLRSIEVYPESYPASTLLSRLTQSRQGIAVVVDEFGGTSGIVSIEDIIEEIFGEIDDEFDEEETSEEQISETEFRFSTRLELDYLNETYKFDLPESDEYETLAGFILHIHESIPELGDEILFDKYKITVTKAKENRIEEVKIKLLD
jgi:putative hemolysin